MLQAQLISISHQHSIRSVLTGLRYKEYIGTGECFTSLLLCGQWLNSAEGRNSAAGTQTFSNIGEVNNNHGNMIGGLFTSPHHINI